MTAQVHEMLILDGERCSMNCTPAIPPNHPRIRRLAHDEVDADDPRNDMVFSTACWREDIGTWEVRDERLYLNDIAGIYQIAGQGPVFADWVSETLSVPRGKMLQYVHMGFGTMYEGLLLIEVKEGVVVSRRASTRAEAANPWEAG